MRFASSGWAVVAGSTLAIAFSPGTIVFYTLGVLMGPISAATGWSRGDVSLAASVFTLVLIFAIPAAGAAVDRYGVRRVVIASVAMFGAGLVALGCTRTLVEFYIAFGVLAALGAGANSVCYMRAICTWFDKHRGIAIGIAQSGMGVGLMLMPLLSNGLLGRGGWKFTYAALGVIVLFFILPIVVLLVREKPAADAGAGQAATSIASGASVYEALRQPRFWVLLLAFLFLGGAINSVALHLVPLIEGAGLPRTAALIATSAFGAAMAIGRFVTGFLVDKYFAPYVAAAVFTASSIAIAFLAIGASPIATASAAFLVGIAAGSDGDLLSFLVSRYFGLRSFGRLAAYIFSAYLAGTSFFPWIVGVGAERYGTYTGMVLLCALLGAASAALMILLGPYPKTAQMADQPVLLKGSGHA